MTKIPFVALSKRFFTISLIVIAVVVVSILIFGVQLDIQFRGGAIITYTYEGEIDADAFGQLAQELTETSISWQRSTDIATGRETIVLTLPGNMSLTSDQMVVVDEGIKTRFAENNPETLSISNVNATIGREFLLKSLTAVALAAALMIVFVGFRFRKIGGFSAGVMGVVALLHDLIIVFGVFVIFRIPLNDNFIAVLLTILGYSLNDTIVIYDRIRENKRLVGAKSTLPELVDLSINQSFRRSVNTTITTVTAMTVVTIVAFLFNVSSILTFSGPMIVGLLSGVYSSMCIAGPLWVRWQQHQLARQAAAE